jgi:hypothetical protein
MILKGKETQTSELLTPAMKSHTPSPSPWQGEGRFNSIEYIFIVRSETCFRKDFCLEKQKKEAKKNSGASKKS